MITFNYLGSDISHATYINVDTAIKIKLITRGRYKGYVSEGSLGLHLNNPEYKLIRNSLEEIIKDPLTVSQKDGYDDVYIHPYLVDHIPFSLKNRHIISQ